MRHQRSEAELCQAFDETLQRLDLHGISVKSDVKFHVFAPDGNVVSAPETVDGLESFADAIEYAKRELS